jgi:hypothetical protein
MWIGSFQVYKPRDKPGWGRRLFFKLAIGYKTSTNVKMAK